MTSTEVFTIASKEEGVRALEALGARFSSRLHAEEISRRLYLDTFDWRIRRAQHALCVLETRGERWLVLESFDGASPRRLRVERAPSSVADLPPGDLRDWLAEVAAGRAFLPRVAIQEERRALDVLDEEEKTVCRVVLEGGASWRPDVEPTNGKASAAGPLPPRLRLLGLRGYDEGARRVSQACREELALQPASAHGFDLAVAACGLTPWSNPSRPSIEIAPDEEAEAAVRRVLCAYLDVLEANEDGLRQDLDSEFLHDFRVAIRRSRSVLSLMGDALPASATQPFVDELRWLGDITGPLRDLDVFLLGLEQERELAELFPFVRARRAEEQQKLVSALASERYRRFLAGWRAFLSVPAVSPTATGSLPVRRVAGEELRTLHAGLLERGRKIERRTSARKVHRVRIRAKELRYLLDAFRALYDGEDYAFVLGGLRKLQDALGAYNDLVVQQAALRAFALEMQAGGRGSAALFLDMGSLIERKRRAAKALRRSVAKRFARFDDREERRRFEALLEPAA